EMGIEATDGLENVRPVEVACMVSSEDVPMMLTTLALLPPTKFTPPAGSGLPLEKSSVKESFPAPPTTLNRFRPDITGCCVGAPWPGVEELIHRSRCVPSASRRTYVLCVTGKVMNVKT